MSDLIKVTGLWKTENGKALTGSLGQARVVVFKNNFKKEGSREPDYELYFSESIKRAATPDIDPLGSESKGCDPIEGTATPLGNE